MGCGSCDVGEVMGKTSEVRWLIFEPYKSIYGGVNPIAEPMTDNFIFQKSLLVSEGREIVGINGDSPGDL